MIDLQKKEDLLPTADGVLPCCHVIESPLSRLYQCRDQFIEDILNALSQTLNKIDKTLCKLTNDTDYCNRNQKNINLDDLRIIRIKRDLIESTYKQQLAFKIQNYIDLIIDPNFQDGSTVSANHNPELMTADQSALLALEKKLFDLAKHDLKILNHNIGCLFEVNGDIHRNSPFLPSVICTAFHNSCEQLEMRTKTRLLLVKMLEKSLMSNIKTFYTNISDKLNHLIKQSGSGVIENQVRALPEVNTDLIGKTLPEDSRLNKQEAFPPEDNYTTGVKTLDNELQYDGVMCAKEEVVVRIGKYELPDFIKSFLIKDWNRILQSIYNREGNTSNIWESVVNTMDDLIWSVSPKRTAAERETLINLIPDLNAQLNKGMDFIHLGKEYRNIFFDLLAEYQGKALNFTPDCDEDIDDDEDNLEKSVATTEIDNKSYVTKTILRLIDQGMLDIEEIVVEDNIEADEENKNYIEIARNLKKGDWLELHRENEPSTKVRLAWINTATGMRIFTNSLGVQVFEKSLQELAVNLRSGYLQIAEKVSIVDKAMGSFMGNFKVMENG